MRRRLTTAFSGTRSTARGVLRDAPRFFLAATVVTIGVGFVVAELERGASGENIDSIPDKTRHINPLLETLQDDFNDARINAAKWSDNFSVTEGGGTFNFNLDSNSSEIYSRNSYDLRGSSFVLKASFDRLQNSVDSLFSVRHHTPVERQIYFSIFNFGDGNRISFGHYNGSFNALGEIAYDPTAHRWLRLRESAGTMFWDTSPDGVVWTNRHSEPVTTFSTMDLGAVRVYLLGADWIAEPNGFKLRIDDYNFAPIPAKSRARGRVTAVGCGSPLPLPTGAPNAGVGSGDGRIPSSCGDLRHPVLAQGRDGHRPPPVTLTPGPRGGGDQLAHLPRADQAAHPDEAPPPSSPGRRTVGPTLGPPSPEPSSGPPRSRPSP